MIFKNVLQKFSPLRVTTRLSGDHQKGRKFNRERERVKSKLGFTLIELLIVIAIIGLLSSVVLASLNGARSKARDARTLIDVKQIITALELARDNSANDKYPASAPPNVYWSCLKPSGQCWKNNYNGGMPVINALSSFLPSIPKPQVNNSSCYMYDSYLYSEDRPAFDGVNWTGRKSAYIIYTLERPFNPGECQTPDAQYFHDCGLSYCYKFIGYND